ncbi:uncharacterized protein B0H18DRAFT_995868 [Fomitopsis serialis]|uniref:uncharacterized protein n=1 Tax=Fomitopsis serialis TaxID=139415 RepID=UPI0020078049|nr:uncharacterized protein B0H18DRAFT_995868 [Neoantrodia serialis]KAH9929716.1 hypothetical protein B0H18DRAFT_995868 [Neoantrodia serialis]
MQHQNQIYYESLLPSPSHSSVAENNTSVATNPSVLRASQAGLDVGSLPQQNPLGLGMSTPYVVYPIGPLATHGPSQFQQDENRKPSGGSTPAIPNTGPTSLAYLPRHILESPLLRSRNPSTVGHALYAVNPVQAHSWYPAQAYAEAANPVYRPHMPTWQLPYMPPVPSVPYGGQWERGNFTAMLQDAIPVVPADSAASLGSSQETTKGRRQDSGGQRGGRMRTSSCGV